MFYYLRASLLSSVKYKANIFGFLLITALTYVSRFLFIDRLIDFADGGLGGWTRDQVINLYYSGILVAVLSWSVASSIDEFYRYAYLGKLDPHLMRPVSIMKILFVRWIAGSNLLALFFIFPLCIIDRWHVFTALTHFQFFLAVVALIFGVVTIVASMLIVYSLTLILQRQIPIDYIFSELFRLTQIPPTIFNGVWIGLLILGMPLILGTWAPAAVLNQDYKPMIHLLIVGIITILISFFTVSKSLKFFDGLGG